MSRFVRNAGLALLLLVFAACRDATGPKSVAEARELWQAQNLTTYSYIGSRACFCVAPDGPVTVDVVNGSVSRVRDLTSLEQVSSLGWRTVEELFDLAESAQPQILEFDKDLGFPKRIERQAADDSWFVYTVTGVAPLRVTL